MEFNLTVSFGTTADCVLRKVYLMLQLAVKISVVKPFKKKQQAQKWNIQSYWKFSNQTFIEPLQRRVAEITDLTNKTTVVAGR